MNYIFYALLAAFSFGIGTLISKFASKHALKTWEKLWFYFFIIFSPIAAIVSYKISTPIWLGTYMIYPALNSLLFVSGAILFFKSILRLDASVMTSLFQTQGVAIAILAFLFLGEKFIPQAYIWMLLLVTGSIIVSYDEKLHFKSFVQVPVLMAIVANISFAASNIFAGFTLKVTSNWNLIFWTAIFNIVYVLILSTVFIKPKLKVSFKQISPVFGSSLFQFIGVISLYTAYKENLSISGIISLLSAPIVFIITVITSKWFPSLLEHHTAKVYIIRGLGLLVILFSAVKLSLAS